MKMTREERVEGLLARDRELMERLGTATKDEVAALLDQRKRIKMEMNLYGPDATMRLLRQDFEEYTDLVTAQEEARRARWAKHPALLEEMRRAAREAAE